MEEIKYADEDWIKTKELGETDVPVRFTGLNGEQETRFFRIRKIDSEIYEDIRNEAIPDDGKNLRKAMSNINDSLVLFCVVKPQLDRGLLHEIKKNKEAGIFEALLDKCQSFSGISAEQILESKKWGSPESPSVQE